MLLSFGESISDGDRVFADRFWGITFGDEGWIGQPTHISTALGSKLEAW